MSGFEENEISINANGGTELAKRDLARLLPTQLLNNFQIICSRVRWIDEEKIRIYWVHDLPVDPECKKLADLNRFYDSSECWTYTVYTDVKQYASLTKDADFFAKLLPSCGGKQIQVFDDNNVIIQYDLSVEKANNLNYQINAINGILVKAKKLNLEKRINLATNIDDITNIDYQNELLHAVERKINLDSIK